MFNPMPRIAGAVLSAGGGVAIQRGTHSAIAHSVNGDLQAKRIGFDADLRKLFGVKQRSGSKSRLLRVIIGAKGGPRIKHAVHEHFDTAKA